ncbi:putative BRO1 domain-containing protein [Helianthus debilis subsp. tardiflorus]
MVFEAVFGAEDSGTLEQLKELSSKRVNIESMYKNKSVPGPNAECEQDIQKLELYLPSLDNLVQHVDFLGYKDPRVIRLISNLKIKWTSPLSSTCSLNIMGPKFFQVDSLRFELGLVLFFYGSLLRERASQVLDTDLVQSATLFRKAAGVYQYLGHDVLPFIRAKLSPHGPPEATSSVSSVMSLICLAEAQMVTIMKAEEKKTADGLLSKLHYGVVQLLDEATDSYSTAAKECKEISPGLMDYISCSKALHKLRSYKHMAEGVKTEGQMGTAIGLLKRALNSKVQKNVGGLESWRKVIKQDMNALTELLRRYEHENDFVWSEKVPCDEHLPMLQGKKIATCIPYCPARWERTLKLKI